MINYQLSNKAVVDLRTIWNYSKITWSESQADKYYKTLIKAFNKISKTLISARATMKSIINFWGSE